ncbi:hypothetical protein GCM10010981_24460 [Dyella nitratireducens]|uniref:Uncharacterized protein n=1 Tax=Dyella nitratireducens TaxID=1849580 RepID=A0ABQ1G211_9GAMM|nr:hypothetical protein GCM10010981_24460 [Dyella nitratireducens]GLQ40880.1 hypothetical protein GCM10007902_07300 [Dyella nitratireducens]
MQCWSVKGLSSSFLLVACAVLNGVWAETASIDFSGPINGAQACSSQGWCGGNCAARGGADAAVDNQHCRVVRTAGFKAIGNDWQNFPSTHAGDTSLVSAEGEQ